MGLMFMRKDENSKTSLVAQLNKISNHLESKSFRFLTGDTMCCFDCELMPKLQHIRVAGAFFCNFEIPANLVHLWTYIREMYQLDAFLQSNPADQDIINIYKDQLGVRTVKHEELESPKYTTSVPSTLAA